LCSAKGKKKAAESPSSVTDPKPQGDLFTLLAEAVTDGYQRKRSKKARYRPKQSEKKKKKLQPLKSD